MPIIQSWQSSHTTTVHVATSEFSGSISQTMVVAPNTGIFADGHEDIAFGYLNAAGIPDSLGNTWTAASPDALDLAEVHGPSLVVHNDGSLFDQEGDPAYCQLMSMHWGVKDSQKPEGQAVVAEVRSFLGFRTHFFGLHTVDNCQGGIPQICNPFAEAEPEACDNQDNDCDGETDEIDDSDTLCPPGSECVDCQCALPCSEAGEFGIRCPSGKAAFTLDSGDCYCVAERCQREDCAEQTVVIDGETLCAPASDLANPCVCKNNRCTYACDGVICPNNTICDGLDGRCKEDSCINFGCGEGEICNRDSGECAPDPCLKANCVQGEVCYQGDCFALCDEDTPCSADRRCVEGRCKPCEPGECVETQDKPDTEGSEEDPNAKYSRLLATGGGGRACEIAGSKNNPTSRGALWSLTICLLGLLFVRRRILRSRRCSAGTRRPALIIALFVLLIMSIGCSIDSFCLDCPSRNPLTKDSGISSHAEGGDQVGSDGGTVETDSGKTDFHRDGGRDSACLDTERCNGEDDDCDGLIDEDFDLDSDPNNCGSCGVSRSYDHAFAQCVDGSCRFSGCDVGFHSLDNNQDNGCEYACLKSAEDDSLCDQSDNDCNGVIDDAFDLQNDPNHCGRCNNECVFFKQLAPVMKGAVRSNGVAEDMPIQMKIRAMAASVAWCWMKATMTSATKRMQNRATNQRRALISMGSY